MNLPEKKVSSTFSTLSKPKTPKTNKKTSTQLNKSQTLDKQPIILEKIKESKRLSNLLEDSSNQRRRASKQYSGFNTNEIEDNNEFIDKYSNFLCKTTKNQDLGQKNNKLFNKNSSPRAKSTGKIQKKLK